jgi:putative N6-adenine-specific DNA methylase
LEAIRFLYKEFGDFLKQRCQGSTAYVLCGNLELIPAIGLKPARRFPLFNGPIECRLLKIEIY